MHCMNADLSDLLRLLQNLIRLGTIAEVKGAKARVRLGPTLTTEWLKWATRRGGSTRTWSAPTIGEQVIVFSPGGDLTRGIMLPALYSQEFGAPESSDTVHTTHYPDGAVVHDHAAHALTATLPGGTATSTANKVTSNAPSAIGTGGRHHGPEWRRERQRRAHQQDGNEVLAHGELKVTTDKESGFQR